MAESAVTVTINGRAVTAQPGELLIEVAERAGSFVPRFCYHPRMAPVGICRMCLVEVEGPRGATLQPACFIPVTDGLVAHTESDKVKKAQDGVLEFLLANHPLDCPVCDKGGECPLQDQALAHGSGESRYIEEKRHFAKPISIGDHVLLDRERCIQCARCTRFAAEVAGEPTIDFAGRGGQIEVAPFPTEPFDSVFSGNTVQICPVGALTAKPYRFTARPWDLEQVESTCTTCAVGCRVAVQSSGDRLTRVLGVDSDAVNHGWLCDKGRFAIEATNAESATDPTDRTRRITTPFVRRDGRLEPASWDEALDVAADLLHATAQGGANQIGVIGGAALTNEGAFAWRRLLGDGLETPHLDCQYGDGLPGELLDSLPRATIDEAAAARAVVLLCGDLRQELPVLFLRLRAAAQRGTAIIDLGAGPSALASSATVALPARPGEAVIVALALGGDATAAAALAADPHGAPCSAEALEQARTLLGDGTGVVVVVGRANGAESAAVPEAAVRALATALPHATFLSALRRGNVHGALAMGLRPTAGGRDALAQLRAITTGEQTLLVLLGGDLTSNVADRRLAESALSVATTIAVTGHGSPDLAHCAVVLPAAVGYERRGTVTNLEGRVTNLEPKTSPPGAAWGDVTIAEELADRLGLDLGLGGEESASAAIEEMLHYPAAVVLAAPSLEGVVVGRSGAPVPRHAMDPIAFPGVLARESVPQPPRDVPIPQSTAPAAVKTAAVQVPLADAYALRVLAARQLIDQGAAVAATPALAPLAVPFSLSANPYDLDRLGAATGDVLRVVTPRGAFPTAVTADPTLARGTVLVPLFARGDEAVAPLLIDSTAVVTEIRLESM